MNHGTRTPALLTFKEVCAQLNIPTSTAYKLRGRGDFPPALNVGGTLRWRPTDITQWIEDSLEDTHTPTSTDNTQDATLALRQLTEYVDRLPNMTPADAQTVRNALHDACTDIHRAGVKP